MEGGREMRRSMTLSDHMSSTAVVDSSGHLRDLLRVRDQDGEGGGCRAAPPPVNRRSLTLGTANASGAGQTLMDVIRGDHAIGRGQSPLNRTNGTAVGGGSGNDRTFNDHLRIRREGGDEDVNRLPTSPVFSRSMTGHRNETSIPRAGSVREENASEHSPPVAEEVVVSSSAAAAEEAQPVRVSLMALLEQTDGHVSDEGDEEEEEEAEAEEEEEGGGLYHVCCVCMVRHKGAAFIPCGHTFCRLCSRELWVSRGNCPLCNGYILEILDIF